jgi:hypothetical protein
LFAQVLVGDNSSYDYYGDSDLETIEEPVRRRHVSFFEFIHFMTRGHGVKKYLCFQCYQIVHAGEISW